MRPFEKLRFAKSDEVQNGSVTIIKTIFLFFFFCCVFNSLAQTIQTYSGAYDEQVLHLNKDGLSYKYGGVSGNAVYQYYETSNNERIYNGSFSLKKYPQLTPTITGTFKDNLREGNWTINRYSTPGETNYEPCIETVKCSFIKGKLNGLCTYIEKDKKTGKVYRSSKASFINNRISGVYEFTENEIEKFTIKINYDSTGNYDGDYLVNYWINKIEFEDKRLYSHGTLISELHRNKATGDKLNTQEYKNSSGGLIDMYMALEFWFCTNSGYNGCARGDNPLFDFAKGIVLETN